MRNNQKCYLTNFIYANDLSSANDGKIRMISCGADKSIYFRTAHKVRQVAQGNVVFFVFFYVRLILNENELEVISFRIVCFSQQFGVLIF